MPEQPPPSESSGVSPSAEAIYLRAFAEASARDEPLDIDRLCEQHRPEASALRRMHAEVLAAMRAAGTSAPAPAETDFDTVIVGTAQSGRRGRGPGLLARLLARRRPYERYRTGAHLGRGGMGEVTSVWDTDLNRFSALKRIREVRPDGEQPSDSIRTRMIDHFLEEVQLTGQLEHPGIVPVHEVGVDGHGRVYFTMRLVRGDSLARVFEQAAQRDERWTQTRIVGLLLRVCETMAFAHAKGVIHRDLKPDNIMIGRFGETYVMDWGVARVLNQTDRRDMTIRASTIVVDGAVDRDDGRSPVVTMDGHVVGTPCYMSPEQALGNIEAMGPRSDVYAVGAILYELLTGRPPYVGDPANPPSLRTMLQAIQSGPPRSIDQFNRHAPPELAAICTKAMSRAIEDRFETMQELAENLRAYLEGHVVRAYQRGPVAELRKWMLRNRGFAAVLALLILVFITSGFVIGGLERRRANETALHLDEELAAVLVAEADALWPIHPATVPRMDAWLQQARALVARMPPRRARLAAIVEQARGERNAAPSARQHRLDSERARLEAFRAEFAAALPSELLGERDRIIIERQLDLWGEELNHLTYEAESERLRNRRFNLPTRELEEEYRRLASLVAEADRLGAPPLNLIERIESRRRRARELQTWLEDPAWGSAIASIADQQQCPQYGGLEITPQLGLLPLRRNAHGLWEFWHVLSGERPTLDVDGSYRIEPETGIVMILVPGSRYSLGASDDPAHPDYDPRARPAEIAEAHYRSIDLHAYFLSRYEMTQAQWHRATGSVPAENFAALDDKWSDRVSLTHPVEQVSWTECRDVLERWLLQIPTEAQWECAARGGMSGPFWLEAVPSIEHANAFDICAFESSTADLPGGATIDPNSLGNDGYTHHAPVSTFPANPFGLHHVLGNVREWTQDIYSAPSHVTGVLEGSGELLPRIHHPFRTLRGGGFEDTVEALRVTQRGKSMPHTRDEDIGVRPARRIDTSR